MIKYLKNLLNNDSVSEEIVSTKTKYPEVHVQLGSLELCREYAEARAKMYPSDKVKINDYTYRSGVVRGTKVIPFISEDLDGNPSECYIYKIVGNTRQS